MNQALYEELTDKYMGKILNVLQSIDPSGSQFKTEDINSFAEVLCDCVLESLKKGSASTRFSYEIAERQAKVEIQGEDLPDGVAVHYYWNMIAGFTDMGEATECKKYLEVAAPDKVYCLFVDGVPIDYE